MITAPAQVHASIDRAGPKGRDLRRDHQIPATPGRTGHGAACRDNPHAACPAGIHEHDHEGDLDQHIRAGRPTAAGCPDYRKCQRTRVTAPQQAKQPPVPTAALPPKGTTGRLATGPAARSTAGAAPAADHTARTPRGPAIAEPHTLGPKPMQPPPPPDRAHGKLAASESWKETLTSYAAGGHFGGQTRRCGHRIH